MFTRNHSFAILILSLLVLSAHTQNATADNWTIDITVDNQYDIYFGDSLLSVPFSPGGDNDWTTVENYTATGVSSTDYLYVATASDHSVAQGFLGSFTNTTTATTLLTSDDSTSPWEVFPAGQYLVALNGLDASIPAGGWPVSLQPTSSQVSTAVAYATNNNLWVDPVSVAGYNNVGPGPWFTFTTIPTAAEWIWHDSGGTGTFYPDPFGGFNHNEFLVFRVPGQPVPEPSSIALLIFGAAALTLLAYRRRSQSRYVAQ